MQDLTPVVLIGAACVIGGLVLSWALRPRLARVAGVLHIGAAVLARVLGAVASAWTTARVLDKAERLATAAALCFLALWLVLSAALLLYALTLPDDEPVASR